jgi:hypothetical protein
MHCVPQRTPELQRIASVEQAPPLSRLQSLTPNERGIQSNDSIKGWVSLGQGNTLPSAPQPAFENSPVVSLQQVTSERAHEFELQLASETNPSGQLHLSFVHTRC